MRSKRGLMGMTVRLIRLVALWFAVLALIGQGAQAKLVQDESGTLTLPICSIDGTRFVTVELGGDDPEPTSELSCDHIVMSAGPVPEAPNLFSELVLQPEMHSPTLVADDIKRSPIWPGAPPIGPPSQQG